MKTAFITGATSGIGRAIARRISKDYRLILCGRRQDHLSDIEAELSKHTDVFTLQFDVREKKAVFSSVERLPTHWRNIDVLINNAGSAQGLDAFQDANLEDLENMIDSNLKGLIYVSKAVLPFIINQGKGHIINISSTAGKQAYGGGAVYCASKWGVEGLSKGMRIDLLPLKIKVTAIAPGAVKTEFSMIRYKGDQARAESVYSGFQPLVAEDVAETVHFALSQPEHVQIADLTVTPRAQADVANLLRT